ncbi:MAG: tetratricopeptide repeat protein [Candidatus Paceibacterota bacterium]|jgi:tetratricopeptide (TPR) repeat protein
MNPASPFQNNRQSNNPNMNKYNNDQRSHPDMPTIPPKYNNTHIDSIQSPKPVESVKPVENVRFVDTKAKVTTPETVTKKDRLEKWAFNIFMLTAFLVPISFWPTQYLPMESVKSFVIVVGTVVSAILFGVIAIRERRLALPPKNISWTASLLVISLLVSSLVSINIERSLFGQGFESGTAGFLIALFVSALVAFALVYRKSERAVLLYTVMATSYLILFVFHLLRIVFGPNFATLSVLNSATSSIVGNWYSLGLFSIVVAIVSFIALSTLTMTSKSKMLYWILLAVSTIGALIINIPFIWALLFLTFVGYTIYVTSVRPKTGTGIGSFFSRLAWIPLVICILLALLSWKNESILSPVVSKIYGGHSELSLPWQMTLDVTAGTIKNYPLLGVGSNHFLQAFLAYKPNIINSTPAWNVEFNSGFGYVPTLISAQGTIGSILWLIFFVFLGISGYRVLRRMPNDEISRFTILSSYTGTVFLWLTLFIYVPSHAIIFLTFVMTGIFFGSAASYGLLNSWVWTPRSGDKWSKTMFAFILLLIVIAAILGVVYAKKTLALSYFGKGISELNVTGDPVLADAYFRKAQAIDSSDVYWQARAEASMAYANKLASSLSNTSTASTTETVMTQIVEATNQALTYSRNAINFDPTNYYNFVSEARVSEFAAGLQMANGYENAVQSYGKAIGLNPFNPSLYLGLAKLQARMNKLDDALTSTGAALQTKNNYLDAIFLLSQIYAAKGNLPDAIIAAKVALEINPENPIILFQLGLLEYNMKNYPAAEVAFAAATKYQTDYANARYFLGLSYARQNKSTDAIREFEEISKTNPDNQEISLILSNLKSGQPIFTDAVAPITPNPEKRSTLPIKEKSK